MSKSKLSVLFAVLVAAQTAAGQEQPQESGPNTFLDRASAGIKLALNFPSMSYSNEGVGAYPSSIYFKGAFGLFCEYSIWPSFGARPGLKFVTRGQHIEETDFTYELNASYAEIDLPLFLMFKVNNVYPYLIGGPVLGVALGGDIKYRRTGQRDPFFVKVNTSNFNPYAVGLFIGAGARYPFEIRGFPVIPGFEAGYHLGLTNTYSDKELSGQADALNKNAYDVVGSRSNRGFECGITVSVPLRAVFEKRAPDPRPEPEPEPPAPAPAPEKPCHTIDEVKELIKAGEDIRGKKICAINQISFQIGSSVLTPGDKVYLDEIVILMRTNDQMKIRVNGHTDNIGDDEFNRSLSRERAKAVHDYLEYSGIDASRLSFTYFGKDRPIADNNTEEGRAINRRVEFEFINQ